MSGAIIKGRIPFKVNNQRTFTVSELLEVFRKIEERGGGGFEVYLDFDEGCFCTALEVNGDTFTETATDTPLVAVMLR